MEEGTWFAIPEKVRGNAVDEHMASRVYDLVKYATSAHRLGHGNIMWMCWQPCGAGEKPTRVSSPRSGSMLVMLSKRGAQHLKAGFEKKELERGHFDVALLRWLVIRQHEVGAAYLLPPMGNYVAHVSGCEAAFAKTARPSCWKEKWCCPGTREHEDPKERQKYWCSFSKSGHAPSLGKVSVDNRKELYWRTLDRSASSSTAAAGSSEDRAQERFPKPMPMAAAMAPATAQPMPPNMAMAKAKPVAKASPYRSRR